MAFMNKYLHSVSGFLLPILFTGIFGYFFFAPQWNTIVVRLHVEAGKQDSMVFYWPSRKGVYSEKQSRRVHYPLGISGHELTISAYPNRYPLRFDPGELEQQFRIQNISFERFGATITFTQDEIEAQIKSLDNVQTIDSVDGAHFLLQLPDPQVYLAEIPYPLPDWKLIAAFVCLLLLMTITGRWLLTCSANHLVQMLAVIMLTLLLCAMSGGHPLYMQLILSVLYAITPVLFFYRIAWAQNSRLKFSSAGALLLVLVFSAILWVPLTKTLTGDFLDSVQRDVLKMQSRKESAHSTTLKIVHDALRRDFITHFAFRDWLIHLNARFKISTLGFSPSSKAILGKDGMFFEGYGRRRVEGDITRSFDNVTDYMGQSPFSMQELEAWRICLEERYYWLREQGIDYVFVLAPTKALVYPENLPARLYRTKKSLNKPVRYEQLIHYLHENSIVPVVDLQTHLLKAKQTADFPLFYRTDFHWNYYGSLVAYQAIIKTINQYYPKYDLQPATRSEFTIKRIDNWVHRGFMGLVGLDPLQNKNETYLTFFPEADGRFGDMRNFVEKGISDYSLPEVKKKHYGNESLGVREIENPSGKIPLMVIIGDSFIEKTLGYFSVHNQRTVNFRAVTNFPIEPYKQLKPDIVVQEILNMYILQPPPVNPSAIKQARKRILSALAN